jgi:hypothetical protein
LGSWFICLLVYFLFVDWFFNLLVCWLASWVVGLFVCLLVYLFVGWLAGLFIYLFIYLLVGWLVS